MPDNNVLSQAEQFICRLYDPDSTLSSIQAVRCKQFHRMTKRLENMAPTSDALRQHILREHYQARIWRNSTIPDPLLPEPTECGWYEQGEDPHKQLLPRLTTKEALSDTCIELISCRCSAEANRCSSKRCSCVKSGLKCTSLCHCTIECRNPKNTVA